MADSMDIDDGAGPQRGSGGTGRGRGRGSANAGVPTAPRSETSKRKREGQQNPQQQDPFSLGEILGAPGGDCVGNQQKRSRPSSPVPGSGFGPTQGAGDSRRPGQGPNARGAGLRGGRGVPRGPRGGGRGDRRDSQGSAFGTEQSGGSLRRPSQDQTVSRGGHRGSQQNQELARPFSGFQTAQSGNPFSSPFTNSGENQTAPGLGQIQPPRGPRGGGLLNLRRFETEQNTEPPATPGTTPHSFFQQTPDPPKDPRGQRRNSSGRNSPVDSFHPDHQARAPNPFQRHLSQVFQQPQSTRGARGSRAGDQQRGGRSRGSDFGRGRGGDSSARPFNGRRNSEPQTPSEVSSLGAAQRRKSDTPGYPAGAHLVTQDPNISDPSPSIGYQTIKGILRELNQAHQLGLDNVKIKAIATKAGTHFQQQQILGKPIRNETAITAVRDWIRRHLNLQKSDTPPSGQTLHAETPSGPGKKRAPDEDEELTDAPAVVYDSQLEQPQHNPFGMASQLSAGVTAPNLGQFLTAINGFVQAKNETSLASWLVLEPPFNQQYLNMVQELQQHFPKGSEDALERKCTQSLPVASSGMNDSPTWSQFVKFMVEYLGYLRDVSVDQSKYLETYELLYELQKRATSALNHPLGPILLPTVISCARTICRLAIGLDKQPELIAHLRSNKSGGEDGGRETLPERAAESIRQALTSCLNDRASGLDDDGKPEGKKRGIYILANICLKIFFQCRKTRNAEMIFTTIRSTSPPLAAYPKRERVTYLYYLGRYWFQNNHFHRAQLALQEAYEESPVSSQCIRQRRHILVYLITCNIIMGRFPSQAIFQRPEAQDLQERFMPVMQAIRTGNLTLFRQYLDLDGPNAPWFLHFRILLQLRNRCEVLVWRSLIRKVWILNGTRYEPGVKTAPLVSIDDLVCVFRALEKQAQKPEDVAYIDPDFDPEDYGDDGADDQLPSSSSLESILSSLVDQGFLRGFIAHRQQKFVITGAKQAGGDALAAGFPLPWKVIQQKVQGMDEVPGWKKAAAPNAMLTGGLSGGMVVNLSGARAAGAA